MEFAVIEPPRIGGGGAVGGCGTFFEYYLTLKPTARYTILCKLFVLNHDLKVNHRYIFFVHCDSSFGNRGQ